MSALINVKISSRAKGGGTVMKTRTATNAGGGSGDVINAAGLQSFLDSIASVTNLANALAGLFTPYKGETPKDWADVTGPDSYDSIRANKGVWTEYFLTTRGMNGSGDGSDTPSGGASTLAELTDTDISGLVQGQVLTCDGSKWRNATLPQQGLNETQLGNYLAAHGYITSITKGMVEAVLTGDITSHTHPDLLRSWWPVEDEEVGGYDCDTQPDYSTYSFASFTYYNNAPFMGSFVDISVRGYGFLLGTQYNWDGPLYYRRHGLAHDGALGEWQRLARTTGKDTDNVASASKLETSHTLWGRAFDGTQNVSGSLGDVGHIGFTGNDVSNIGDPNHAANSIYTNRIYSGLNQSIRIAAGTNGAGGLIYLDQYGRVGVGTASPVETLHVAGTIYATTGIHTAGYITARQTGTASDARLKDIIGDYYIALQDIAAAPSIHYTWKDTGMEDVGSIAQYFQKLNPLLVTVSEDGTLGLQYGKTALLSAISLAREVTDLKQRIAELEKIIRNLTKK